MTATTTTPQPTNHEARRRAPGAAPATAARRVHRAPRPPRRGTPPSSGTATSARRRWLALAVLMLPVLLVSIDNTVLSFALPQISEALTPTSTQLLWIVDVYPLVLAALLVPMGSLADRVGRRRLLLVGAVGFAAMSVVAAQAPTAAALIAARVGLGVFGSMLMPSTLSLLRNIFTDRGERRLAVAVWASGFAAGAALGPIVGGLLLEHLWWGSVFWIAVPVLVLLLLLAPAFVPESRDPDPGPVDVPSILLSVATMAPVVWGIKVLGKDGPSALALVAMLVGLGAGALFVRRQLRRPRPMLDVRLFTDAAFTGSVLINLLSVLSYVGFLYFASQDLQLVIGLGPSVAGLALLPGLVVMIAAGLLVVRVVRSIRPSHVVAGALTLSAAAYAIMAVFGGHGTLWPVVVSFVVLSVGIGAAETLSNDLVVSSAPPHQAGAASAISETAYEIGAVLGTAVLGSILAASYAANLVVPRGVGHAAAQTATETLGGATAVAQSLPAAQASALLDSAHAAFGTGVAVTAGIGVVTMIGAAVLALVALRRAEA
ncbi:MFS transporter [Cellulomonas sp. PhB143]|uniref:MFS transporter n=1 Tax=Cellulomonas sp. PhB143 TaxID=2485186 RepID=UPI000F47B537|nr:MFS transporter [Cellulomonas sp. PhB143]ROS73637.1 DHA2 family multidrug resistance protein-like MFS transporter [Cellulomonas sp. PhB143]